MEERIHARIVELEEAERQVVMQLTAIRSVIAELKALATPAPVFSGDALEET